VSLDYHGPSQTLLLINLLISFIPLWFLSLYKIYKQRRYHSIMENQDINQGRIEPKIHVSRDGKWVIMRIPGVEQPIIKSVNYLKAILDNAEKRQARPVNVEQIKG
jgi:hypothetical protein